ncbi:hypothetical protein BCR43DRAFT_498959 [Syncephalastrum racemosum]|uniref:Uncharacterized protein n=1 Tax=Syncephalastrum racemosum TaxID=13706 RepID=A0A1X2H1R1_SYNRA|nr:hypothetical protein BCR43DRAFT_498959 [Syncephalastrum racemosum]
MGLLRKADESARRMIMIRISHFSTFSVLFLRLTSGYIFFVLAYHRELPRQIQ